MIFRSRLILRVGSKTTKLTPTHQRWVHFGDTALMLGRNISHDGSMGVVYVPTFTIQINQM